MIKKIILLFLAWRILLFIVAFLAVIFIPLFGGRFPYYDYLLANLGLPSWVWGFANFDGVHYLRLAISGYPASQYTQAFFPLYPLLLKLVSIGHGLFLNSLIVTNLMFLMSLVVFYKLIRLDYEQESTYKTILLLLSFPTAYYFGSVYSESLFLLLVILSIYLLRTKRYFWAGIVGALASGTRIFGLLLIPVFIIEIILTYKNFPKTKDFYLKLMNTFLVPLGTLLYMAYLQIIFNNPLYFLTSQPFFGAERSNLPIILLPQVLFRYAKMFLVTPVTSLQFINLSLEILFTIMPLMLVIIAWKKIRLSYIVFTLGCLLIPTFTGTLSSMPRYALMSFLLLPLLAKLKAKYYYLILGLFIILEAILVSLFTRGYWVA